MIIIGLLLILVILIIFICLNYVDFFSNKKMINGGKKKKKKKKKKKAQRKKKKGKKSSSGNSGIMPVASESSSFDKDPGAGTGKNPETLSKIELLVVNIFMCKMMGDGKYINENNVKEFIKDEIKEDMLLKDLLDALFIKYLNIYYNFLLSDKKMVNGNIEWSVTTTDAVSVTKKYLMINDNKLVWGNKSVWDIKSPDYEKILYSPYFILCWAIFYNDIYKTPWAYIWDIHQNKKLLTDDLKIIEYNNIFVVDNIKNIEYGNIKVLKPHINDFTLNTKLDVLFNFIYNLFLFLPIEDYDILIKKLPIFMKYDLIYYSSTGYNSNINITYFNILLLLINYNCFKKIILQDINIKDIFQNDKKKLENIYNKQLKQTSISISLINELKKEQNIDFSNILEKWRNNEYIISDMIKNITTLSSQEDINMKIMDFVKTLFNKTYSTISNNSTPHDKNKLFFETFDFSEMADNYEFSVNPMHKFDNNISKLLLETYKYVNVNKYIMFNKELFKLNDKIKTDAETYKTTILRENQKKIEIIIFKFVYNNILKDKITGITEYIKDNEKLLSKYLKSNYTNLKDKGDKVLTFLYLYIENFNKMIDNIVKLESKWEFEDNYSKQKNPDDTIWAFYQKSGNQPTKNFKEAINDHNNVISFKTDGKNIIFSEIDIYTTTNDYINQKKSEYQKHIDNDPRFNWILEKTQINKDQIIKFIDLIMEKDTYYIYSQYFAMFLKYAHVLIIKNNIFNTTNMKTKNITKIDELNTFLENNNEIKLYTYLDAKNTFIKTGDLQDFLKIIDVGINLEQSILSQGRGGPPQGRGGPPQGRGGPLQGRGGPPQGRGGPLQGRGGPPQAAMSTLNPKAAPFTPL